jgi:PPK2 family polyphosphate:nucleotide phosphotransferase
MGKGRDFRVGEATRVRLKEHPTNATPGFRSKAGAEDALAAGLERLRELQRLLYAQRQWAVLIVFQAMDAGGKDSTIGHVMSGLNPQGCVVHSFKEPTSEELDHDFLWRVGIRLPGRGMIGVFNRSYYEEVLVPRVHPEVLQAERLPSISPRIWEERFSDIRGLERHLFRNGTLVLKFFLHVSKAAQRTRFLSRLREPEKHWKFSPLDVRERARWADYVAAYEDLLSKTSTPEAPWYVVPADHKWFTRLAVTEIIVQRLEELKLHYPKLDRKREAELRAARKTLEREGRRRPR